MVHHQFMPLLQDLPKNVFLAVVSGLQILLKEHLKIEAILKFLDDHHYPKFHSHHHPPKMSTRLEKHLAK